MPLIAHEDCAVIVIDAQPGFFGTDLPVPDQAAAAQALDRAAWLVELAGPRRPGRRDRGGAGAQRATDPRLAVSPALVKPTFGLAGTPEILAAVTRPTAVLVGFETDVCVYQSAVGLLEHGKQVSSSRTRRSRRARCTRAAWTACATPVRGSRTPRRWATSGCGRSRAPPSCRAPPRSGCDRDVACIYSVRRTWHAPAEGDQGELRCHSGARVRSSWGRSCWCWAASGPR